MKTLARLSFPSSQRLDDRLERLPNRQHVVVVRDSDSGEAELFSFDRVEAVRITFQHACTEEMIQAYDQLVEIYDSEWLLDVAHRVHAANGVTVTLRHLQLYLDDGPCYEFLCAGGGHTKPA